MSPYSMDNRSHWRPTGVIWPLTGSWIRRRASILADGIVSIDPAWEVFLS